MLLRSRIFWFQFLLLIVIAVIHIRALTYDLYWHYVWFDLPVHFAAGLWIAVAILWLFRVAGKPHFRILPVLAATFLIGIGWELFEVWAGVDIADANYVFDTSLDLLMDVFGGIVGYGIARFMLLPRRT